MKISAVDPDSPLFGYVRPGDKLLSVNGQQVQDEIDYRYKVTDEQVRLLIADAHGRHQEFDFEEYSAEEIGLSFEDRKIKFCKNDCIFCFVAQQPQGMRRSLYFRDEDYRLSFTHGNFITLSNTKTEDLERIVEQRLSPIYVSVHATDDTLRRCMLKNERLAPIIPRLEFLTDNGITVHSQVVLCPGINDGPQLEKTITDLVELYPGVESLAVVPVGLTKYRENLPNLRTYTKDEAAAILDHIEDLQHKFLTELGSRFVWPADEFYVQAEREFPRRQVYEEMPQFENGIGMAREFITMFNRRKSHLKGINSDRRVMLMTGYSAYPFLSREMMPYVTDTLGLNMSLHRVLNRFWGDMVTVSGLLTGQDLLRHARMRADEYDLLVLPPNCLNNDDLFLDNLSLSQFERVLKKPVLVGQYNIAATIKAAFS
jgi:putative radical SAM enzyme (TIGR03279 family)